MTKIRPPTAAAPRPCRAVGMGARAFQVSVRGSYASTWLKVPVGASPPKTKIFPSRTAAAMPLRAVGSGARVGGAGLERRCLRIDRLSVDARPPAGYCRPCFSSRQ